MKTAYAEPLVFMVEQLIAEREFVTTTGKIRLMEDGIMTEYDYCDI